MQYCYRIYIIIYKYYTYYITPINNVSGAIISNNELDNEYNNEPNKAPIGDNKNIAAPSSPSGIFIGTAFTPPGTRGVVPISANSNISDNFPYNGIHCKVVVEDTSDIFTYLNVSGVDGWNLNTTTYNNSSGYLVLDIIGSRKESKKDSMTIGYIKYEIGNKNEDYVVRLNNILSKLLNN